MKKYLLLGSLILNVVFLYFAVRHFVNAPKQIVPQKSPYWLHRKNIFDMIPIDSNDIIFAGDSHTQRFEVAEFFHSLKVKNRGINYDTSTGLLTRIHALTKTHPSKIFIKIALNDLI